MNAVRCIVCSVCMYLTSDYSKIIHLQNDVKNNTYVTMTSCVSEARKKKEKRFSFQFVPS